MTIAVTPHLNFRGQARAALEFYHTVFGGELTLVSYGDAGQADAAEAPGHIVFGQVAAEDGFRIMAFDVRAGQPHDPGVSPFFVSVRGTSADEIAARWAVLAEGATIVQPLGPSVWSALYGMLVDRFGITWFLDLEPGAA